MRRSLLAVLVIALLGCAGNSPTGVDTAAELANAPSQAKSLSAAALLQRVLAQLDLTAADIKVELLQQKNLTYAANRTVMLLAENVRLADDSSGLDFHLLQLDSSSGKIISRFYQSDASWNAKLGSFAHLLTPSIRIDADGYQLNPTVIPPKKVNTFK